MNKKLIIIVVLALAAGGGAYKFFLAPKPPEKKPKVEGVLVSLDPEFVLNLADGHFAKVKLALEVHHDDPAVAAAGEGGHAAGEPIVLPQDALIRSIVTDRLVGEDAEALLDRGQRHHALEQIRRDIKRRTDTKVEEVLVTDIAVD